MSVGFLIALTLIQIMVALSPNYYFFLFGRFLIGFFIPGGITSFILMCEITGPSQRSLLSVTTAATFGIMYGFLALSAYFIRNWRGITVFTAVMTLVVVLFIRLGPLSLSLSHKFPGPLISSLFSFFIDLL